MSRLQTRLDRLEQAAPPRPRDTPELRRQWCVENGVPTDSVVIGLGGKTVIVLPPEEQL